ncbi:MAG: 4-hydroxy-tetrahydrodipicolinate synthase [Treponema sp.]|jgi:4-hydroxy-tetrahydrodipicolinate synthase|nr:4-hydroxy-tetrahydrodipicolinate synthase [Treponema sp.]
MVRLKGAFTALITPMKDNGDVDYEGFRRLVEFQLDAGIDGFVPLGTSGENPTLDEDEEDELIAIAVKLAHGRVPVIIGTGSNSTRHTVKYTQRAKDMGADAALVVTPYYNKPNDAGLLRHFEAAAGVGLPIVVYNIASRTGRNINAPLMHKLSLIPGIIGVKESSGDINQMVDIIAQNRNTGREFTVLSGDDALTVPLLALGGDGVISVISNLVPAKVSALVKAGLAGDFVEARRLHYELLPLVKAAFVETNPIPIKAAMSMVGLPAGPTRLPLGPLSPENERLLRTTLEATTLYNKSR